MKPWHIIITCLFAISFNAYAEDLELKQLNDDLKRAEASGNGDSIAAAYCLLGEYYAYRSIDTALAYSAKALQHIENKQDPWYAAILCDLGYAHFSLGEIDRALPYYAEARKVAAKLGDTICLSTALQTIGLIYRRKEMPDSTLYYYTEALKLLENSSEHGELAYLLGNMTIFCINEKRFDEGIYYGERAVEAARKSGDMEMMIYTGYACGNAYFKAGRYDEGLKHIRWIIDEAEKRNLPQLMLKGYVTMMQMHDQQQHTDSAMYYIAQGEKLLPGLPEGSAEVLGLLEAKAIVLGKQGDFARSLEIWKRLETHLGENLHTPADKLYLNIARNCSNLRRYAEASAYYEKAYATADSLRRADIDRQLSELTVKYDTRQKELEIAKLQSERAEQNARTTMWTVIAVATLLVLATAVAYYVTARKRQRREEELRLAQSRIDGIERERARIARELHDGVCNDLLGIGYRLQADHAASREALGLIEQVRNSVRHLSHELMPPRFHNVSIAEAIEDYVSTLSSPISIGLDITGDDSAFESTPDQVAYETYRILQELLANVLKHSDATKATVSLEAGTGKLRLSVTDDGHNLDTSTDTCNGGIGLTSIKERAASIGASLTVAQSPQGQEFTLTVEY